jgi:hypothetical protein
LVSVSQSHAISLGQPVCKRSVKNECAGAGVGKT